MGFLAANYLPSLIPPPPPLQPSIKELFASAPAMRAFLIDGFHRRKAENVERHVLDDGDSIGASNVAFAVAGVAAIGHSFSL